MNAVYYAEINIICIIILVIFRRQLRYNFRLLSSEGRLFSLLIWATVLLCVSDAVAGICRGMVFAGARVIIEISNKVFLEALTVISYLWMIYVFTKLKLIEGIKSKISLYSLPLIFFSALAVTNPLTGILFNIDESNLYVRNVGVYLHWFVTWFYLLTATVRIIRCIRHESNSQKRSELVPFLYFIIAPMTSAIIQMFYYGVTVTQVGITISIVIISMFIQRNQVFTDELTGLNNRHALNKYLDSFCLHQYGASLFVVMIDLNNFKHIKDRYGHIAGDRALSDAADALKRVCEKTSVKLFICRYGGDEFLALGYNCTDEDVLHLKELINGELEIKNQTGKNPYTLSASVGIASGRCINSDDTKRLLRDADKAMYGEKVNSKQQAVKPSK